MKAVLEFLGAAAPWIIIGASVAVILAGHAGRTKKKRKDCGLIGMCMGMCIGVALGSVFGTGTGISLGLLAGLAVGTCIERKEEEASDENES